MITMRQAMQAYIDGQTLLTPGDEPVTIIDIDNNVENDEITEREALGRYDWFVTIEYNRIGSRTTLSGKIGSEIPLHNI